MCGPALTNGRIAKAGATERLATSRPKTSSHVPPEPPNTLATTREQAGAGGMAQRRNERPHGPLLVSQGEQQRGDALAQSEYDPCATAGGSRQANYNNEYRCW